VTKSIRVSPNFSFLCHGYILIFLVFIFFWTRCAWLYQAMLDEFLMQILDILLTCYFRNSERFRIFLHCNLVLLGWKFFPKMDWQRQSYHLVTSFSWHYNARFLLLAVCKNAVYVPPLPIALPEIAWRIGAATDALMPPALSVWGVNLNVDLICAGLLMWLLLNICKLLNVGHKNFIL